MFYLIHDDSTFPVKLSVDGCNRRGLEEEVMGQSDTNDSMQ